MPAVITYTVRQVREVTVSATAEAPDTLEGTVLKLAELAFEVNNNVNTKVNGGLNRTSAPKIVSTTIERQ